MEKEPIVFGKKLTPEDEEEVKALVEQMREESRKPLEGEAEKTVEEMKVVDKINEYAAEEFEELGIKEEPAIPPEQIHFLSEEAYDNNFPGEKERGFAFHDPDTGLICVDKSRCSKPQLFKVVFHEAVHTLSFHKYFASVETRRVGPYRAGYTTARPRVGEDVKKFHEHFRGFNEAITEAITKEVMEKHKGDLASVFHFTPEERQKELRYYDEYIKVVDKIVDGIAVKNKEDRADVWRRFKRGIFTGEMMHLRDVERTFGKNSLQLLALLGAERNEFLRDIATKQITKYFETEDPEERQKLAKTILGKGARRIKIEFESN
jgi:hypothetical protein